jgi:hypothetical protein
MEMKHCNWGMRWQGQTAEINMAYPIASQNIPRGMQLGKHDHYDYGIDNFEKNIYLIKRRR